MHVVALSSKTIEYFHLLSPLPKYNCIIRLIGKLSRVESHAFIGPPIYRQQRKHSNPCTYLALRCIVIIYPCCSCYSVSQSVSECRDSLNNQSPLIWFVVSVSFLYRYIITVYIDRIVWMTQESQYSNEWEGSSVNTFYFISSFDYIPIRLAMPAAGRRVVTVMMMWCIALGTRYVCCVFLYA